MTNVGILRFPRWMLRWREPNTPAARSLAVRRTILCIDSCKAVLSTLDNILTEAGYTVFTVDSIAGALAICSENHIDVAILDCGMMSSDHVCFAEQLRNVQRDIELVVWSGSHHHHRVKRCCANVSFLKPVRAPEMLDRLESLLH